MNQLKTIVQVNRNKIAQDLQIANIYGTTTNARVANKVLKGVGTDLVAGQDLWIVPVNKILLASEQLCIVNKQDVFDNALTEYYKFPNVNQQNQKLNGLIAEFKHTIPKSEKQSLNFRKQFNNPRYINNDFGLKQPYLYLDQKQVINLAHELAILIAICLPMGNNNPIEEDGRRSLYFIKSLIILTQSLGFDIDLILSNMVQLEPNANKFLIRFLNYFQ